MRILFFGDVHISKTNEYSKPLPNGLTTLLNECRLSLEWVAEKVLESKADLVVNLGDLFDNHEAIDGASLLVGWEGMQKIYNACEQVGSSIISIVGNHEWVKAGEIYTVPFLKRFGRLITGPEVVDGILFIPYTDDTKAVKSIIFEYLDRRTDKDSLPLIASHLDVVGGIWNNKKSDKGVDVSDIENCFMVNGHFHTPQDIEDRDGTIINVGSLIYKNFKDQYDPEGPERGVLLFDYDEDEISWSRLGNPHTSIFYSVSLKNEEEIDSRILSVIPNDRMNLRIMPTGFTFDESLIKERWVNNLKVLPGVQTSVERHSFDAEADPRALWEHYINTLEIPPDVDKDKCIESGKDILSRAESLTPEVNYEDILITSWEGENFISIGKVEVTVPEDKSVITVVGDNQDSIAMDNNGSGKSSLFEIVPYALWGRTLRGLLIDEVVHTDFPQKGCYTSVKFLKGERHYEIKRARKWGEDRQNILEIYCDGENITERGKAQNQINKLINFSFDEFKHLVYLGGSGHFTELTDDTKRKDLLESIIGTVIYSVAEDIAKQDLAEVEDTVAHLEADVDEVSQDIMRYETKIDDLLHLKELTEQQVEVKTKKWKDRIEDSKDVINETEEKLSKKEKFIDKLSSSLDKWKEKIETLTDQVEGVLDRLSYSQAEVASRIKEKTEKVDLLKRGICPKCGSNIQKKKVESEVMVMEDKITELKYNIQEYESKSDKIKEKIDLAKQQYESLQSKVLNESSDLVSLKGVIRQEKRNIHDYEEEIESAKEEAQVLDPQISEAKESLKDTRKKKTLLEDRLNSRYKIFDVSKFVSDHFHATKLRSFVMDFALNLGNAYIQEMTETFSNGDLQVRISPEKRQKDKVVSKFDFETNAKAPSYKGCSLGERNRMDLMLELSLSALSKKYRSIFNILIIDEEGAGLDDTGMDNFSKVLYNLDRTVFLVSQQSKMKTSSTKRIVATKSNGITSYEFENF